MGIDFYVRHDVQASSQASRLSAVICCILSLSMSDGVHVAFDIDACKNPEQTEFSHASLSLAYGAIACAGGKSCKCDGHDILKSSCMTDVCVLSACTTHTGSNLSYTQWLHKATMGDSLTTPCTEEGVDADSQRPVMCLKVTVQGRSTVTQP